MHPQRSHQPWIVCLAASLFFYYVFFQMSMFNSLNHSLLTSFHLQAAQLGDLASAYFLADAIVLIPAGLLLDRFSTRTLCLIVMAAVVVSTFAFAYTHSFQVAILAHAIAGIGNAFAFLGSLQLASRWLPKNRLAIGMGLIITIGMVAGVVSQTPLTLLIHAVGWRHAVAINGASGILIWVLMFLLMKDRPADSARAVRNFSGSVVKQFLEASRNPQNWICGTYTAFMYLPIVILGELWGVMYLTQTRHFATTTATNITGMIFLGMIFGSPILGWLSDRINRRRLPMIITAVLLLANTLVIVYVPHLSVAALLILFFSLGFISCGQCISYPTMTESNSPHLTSTALSIVAIILNLSSAFFQPIFGRLMHWHYPAAMHITQYSNSDYMTAMISLPFVLVLAIGLSFKVRETFCKPCVIESKVVSSSLETHS